MHIFEADSADQVWLKAVRTFERGEALAQPSRAGSTDELLHTVISIANPRRRWIFSRRPAIPVAFALAEVVWILAGRNDSAFLNFWNSALPQFAGYGDTYYGAYGERLRKAFGQDQLEQAYLALKAKPDNRQIVLQIWNPATDMPYPDGKARAPDIPCNICSLLKVRGGKLYWTQILRSNDIFRGVPFNFVQFTFLQEVMAGWLGLDVGSYAQISDSLHCYDDTRERLLSYVVEADPPMDVDDFRIAKAVFDRAFGTVKAIMDSLTGESIHPEQLQLIIEKNIIPACYCNLLYICAAEAARRHNNPELVWPLVSRCQSSSLKQLMKGWLDRVRFSHT